MPGSRFARGESLMRPTRASRGVRVRGVAAAVLARSRFVAMNVAAYGALVRVIVSERLWRPPSPRRLARPINCHHTDV